MKIPYSIQGALFAPALAVLVFVLKATCPAPSGVGCFADPFVRPLFFPVPFFYAAFGNMRTLMYHEALFVLGYWVVVGLLVGMIVDIWFMKNPKD